MNLARIAVAAMLLGVGVLSSAASAGAGGGRPDGHHEPSWIDGSLVDTVFVFQQSGATDDVAHVWIVGPVDPARPTDPGSAAAGIPPHDHVLAGRIPYGQRPDCRGMLVVAGPAATGSSVDVVHHPTLPDLVRAVDHGDGLEPLVDDDVVEHGVTVGLLDEVYADFEALGVAPITCWTERTIR